MAYKKTFSCRKEHIIPSEQDISIWPTQVVYHIQHRIWFIFSAYRVSHIIKWITNCSAALLLWRSNPLTFYRQNFMQSGFLNFNPIYSFISRVMTYLSSNNFVYTNHPLQFWTKQSQTIVYTLQTLLWFHIAWLHFIFLKSTNKKILRLLFDHLKESQPEVN